MASNTIVISSDSSSLPEVVGDAGILFKNNDVEALKNAICNIQDMTKEERQKYIVNGQERAQNFKWCNEAEKYYKAIVEQN